MKIAILMEGETERVFLPHIREFLSSRLEGKMPKLLAIKYDGRIPKHEKLKREVEILLQGGTPDAHHVIALTDVYTGADDFQDAADAKQKMRSWVGSNERFHPMLLSMILKPGCCPIGRRSSNWRNTTGQGLTAGRKL
jgi:hypothetical protein